MEWITLLQAARLAGITKDAMKYRVKKLPAEYLTRKDGKIYISMLALPLISDPVGDPVGETHTDPVNPSETRQKTQSSGETAVKDPVGENPVKPIAETSPMLLLTIAKQEAQIEAMRELIAEKDKRIEEYAEQLKAVTKSLDSVTQALHEAHAIQAGSVHRELLQAGHAEQDGAKSNGDTDGRQNISERHRKRWFEFWK